MMRPCPALDRLTDTGCVLPAGHDGEHQYVPLEKRGFDDNEDFFKPTKAQLLAGARRAWRRNVAMVAQSLATRYPDMPVPDCVKRAVELTNELNQIPAPEALPLEEL